MMLAPGRAAAAATIVLATALMAVAGCSRQLAGTLLPNSPPQLEVLDARVDQADPTAVRVRWAARDADGSVARTCWTLEPLRARTGRATMSSTRGEECLIPRGASAATRAASGARPEPDLLTLWAVDDRGAESERETITLWGTNVAPFVVIDCPRPSRFASIVCGQVASFAWHGIDPDGWFTQQPVKYRHKLLLENDPEFSLQTALVDPDSMRRFYEARAWAGWDSTGQAVTNATYSSLVPGTQGVFVVIGFDELGDYNADWSLDENMCRIAVLDSTIAGPRLSVLGPGFHVEQPSARWTTDPATTEVVEVASGTALSLSVLGEPPLGRTVRGYRWALDMADPHDQTPRSGPDDLAHWSPWNAIGGFELPPLPSGRKRLAHTLYIEGAVDDCTGQPGYRSLLTIRLVGVTPTYAHDLLIVDDTRLQPDRVNVSGVLLSYSGPWPAAAELDTFLYARGGFPWRGPHGITGNLPLSKPGVFAGYAYDTLGTRGASSGPLNDPPYDPSPSATVPLSVLADYRHVIWLTDQAGAISQYPPTYAPNPQAALRYTSQPGIPNTLAQYVGMGGKVWLLGGTGAYCTLISYNRASNDNRYGSGRTLFSLADGELIPGRPMYDHAHWQSELAAQSAQARPARWTPASGWSHPAWGGGVVSAPDYTKLPALMRFRALSLGDSLPPTRATQPSAYYAITSLMVEYLDLPNIVLEDMNPDPNLYDERSALDTLYQLQGSALSTSITGEAPVSMTWYHGPAAPPFVFSGFDLWTWSRQDVIALVDFVLQDIWGLARQPIARGPATVPARAESAPAPPGPSRAAPRLPGAAR